MTTVTPAGAPAARRSSSARLGALVAELWNPGPLAAGTGDGDGAAVIGDRLYTTTLVGSTATVVIFDVADAMVSGLCDVFEDGFESGDLSAWSGVIP